MEAIFQTVSSDNLVPYEYDQFADSVYEIPDDSYEPVYDAVSDDLASLEQSFPSSSIPNSPGSSDSDSLQQNADQVYVSYPVVSEQQQQQQQEVPVKQSKSPVIKREVCEQPVVRAEPVIRPASQPVRQPAAKRARASASAASAAQPASLPLADTKFPDLLNSDNMNTYMQSLAKGKSEDIELFRNVLRCHALLLLMRRSS